MKFDKIVCFPSIEWSHNWERQQELITRLALEYSSLAVDIFEPLGLINHSPPTFVIKLFTKLSQRGEVGKVYNDKKTPNMKFHSLNFFPYHYNPVIDSLNYNLLNRKTSTQNALVWATYLNGFTFKAFKAGKYKVLDLATRRQVTKELSSKAKKIEIEGVKIADIVFVDNKNTYGDYKNYAKKIIYLPQGVDNKVFTDIKPTQEYLYLKNDGKKIIGYCGTLHKYIDYDFLIKIISQLQEYKFMFVGNVLEPKANNLLKLPNVIFTGQKDHSLLGQYYSLFDIGLIPYTIEPYTSGVFPTKFFEYLICNVPVISSALPDLVNFGSLEFLRIYANQDEFIKSVNYYLDNEDAKSIELKKSNKMRTFAEQNSWDNRFNIIKQELNDL